MIDARRQGFLPSSQAVASYSYAMRFRPWALLLVTALGCGQSPANNDTGGSDAGSGFEDRSEGAAVPAPGRDSGQGTGAPGVDGGAAAATDATA
ncbi:MAG: hypothetical protein M3O50_08810, partial [Myxococcota bacterium]|nr:hypothetical protein [Myxococcota bacterium]